MSVVLLLGGVNAACGRPTTATGGAAPAPMPAADSSGSPAQVWTANVGRRLLGPPVVADTTVYAAGVDRKVYALDLATGQVRWSGRLGGMVTGGVVVSGDTVYAASGRPEGRLYALDAATGHTLWRTSVGPAAAPVALIAGTLVAGSNRGVVSGLDAGTGKVRWRRRLGTTRVPAVPGDDATAIVVTVDSIFRLDAASGRVVARAASPGAIVSPWLPHAAVLVAGTTDSLVVAIDPRTLGLCWRAALDAPVLGTPAARGDTIYAATRRGSLYRVLADSAATRLAELRWPVTAPLALYDDLVLLGGADGTLRALRTDGTEAWRIQLRRPVELAPVLLPDGLLLVGGDGDLHRYRR